MTEAPALRRKIRAWLAVFIVALVLSGVTAFPLQTELGLLVRWTGADQPGVREGSLQWWLATVDVGLRETYRLYPWLSYGTDWLAFAHLVIAVFFIGPYRDPVRNIWVLQSGLIACAGVLFLAMICGPIRGIPFYWQLIDCSFGVFGAIPLAWVVALTRRLEKIEQPR